MLPKGKYPWYNETDKLSQDALYVLTELEKNKQKFPRLPQVILEFEKLLEVETSTSKQLADCIITDPIFSGKIIGAANQRKSRSTAEIKDLAHAVALLGRDTLRSLTTVAAAECIIPKTKHYTSNIIWTEMFLNAVGCAKINSLFKHEFFTMTEDEAFLVGSLCNIGKIVASVFFPDLTDDVYLCSSSSGGEILWKEAEEMKHAFSHTVLGEIAGMFWGFPNFVLLHVAHHHEENHEIFEFTDYLRNNIIRMALCATKVVQGGTSKKVLDEMDELGKTLKFDNKMHIELMDTMREKYEEIKNKKF